MGLIESIIDIFLLGLLGLYIFVGMFSRPLRMFLHLIFSLVFIYVFVYGADQLVAAVPALSELGLSEKNTRASATGALFIVVLVLGWLARRIIDDTGDAGILSMLLCALFGLLRGCLTVWLLILATSYLPRSWGAGIWDSSAMIRYFSGALATTLGVLPQLEATDSYLRRLEFDELTQQPILGESVLDEINETLSQQLEQPQGAAAAKVVAPSRKIRLMRERLAAQNSEQSTTSLPRRASDAEESVLDGAMGKFKDKLAELKGAANIDGETTPASVRTELPSDELLELDEEELTSEKFIARLKRHYEENPDAPGSDLNRLLLNTLEGKHNQQKALDEILTDN